MLVLISFYNYFSIPTINKFMMIMMMMMIGMMMMMMVRGPDFQDPPSCAPRFALIFWLRNNLLEPFKYKRIKVVCIC